MKHSAKRRKFVVGNWKMNPQTPDEARKIVGAVKRFFLKARPSVDVVVCPPYPLIPLFSKGFDPLFLGAQDVFWEPSGSFTGEVSAGMLSSVGCSYVIVGHSERRAFGETDEIISKKIVSACAHNLKVIVCVGEAERDDQGMYLEFLKNQIRNSLTKLSKKHIAQLVVAYEPLWAIGKSYNTAMSGKDMQEISIFIKKTLADMYGKNESAQVPILYGGSVAPINATDIFEGGHIDGFLVGRQSLEAVNFNEIISIVHNAKTI